MNKFTKHMRFTFFVVLSLATSFMLTSCVSLTTRKQTSTSNISPYPGVATNLYFFCLTGSTGHPLGFLLGGILLADLPFSFALDTILLPSDLASVLKREKQSSPKQKNSTIRATDDKEKQTTQENKWNWQWGRGENRIE